MDIQDIQQTILGFADFRTLINTLHVSKSMRKNSEKFIIDILTNKICLDVKEKFIYKGKHSPSPSFNNHIKVEIISHMSKELNKILPVNFVSVPCAFTVS